MKSTPINNVRNNTEQSKKALDFIVKHHIEFLKFQKKQQNHDNTQRNYRD